MALGGRGGRSDAFENRAVRLGIVMLNEIKLNFVFFLRSFAS
jgi:hypothetical protein